MGIENFGKGSLEQSSKEVGRQFSDSERPQSSIELPERDGMEKSISFSDSERPTDNYIEIPDSGLYDAQKPEPGDLREPYKSYMENGEYESVEEMCNDLSLNEYDVYWTEDDFGEDYETDEGNGFYEKIEIDSKKCYYDDKGKIYRIENELLPDQKYEINGYTYETDDKGRIVSVEGQLHMKEREGRLPIKDSIEDIGKGDEHEGDDRGHLIGDQFDGSNGLENMIPQNSEINRRDFKNFENELANKVREGKEVEVIIEPVYDGDSRRPSAIVVSYKIDGAKEIRIFPND